MYHDLPRAASFQSFLLAVDEDLAEETRKKGCPCGGRLHCANYPRKPRGAGLELTEFQRQRLSFCCDRDGCRRRATPPSVRFLGRKVYLAAIVILVSAMRQGPTPRRVRELSERFDADESTIVRWQTFWREHFPQTSFWKIARASLSCAVGWMQTSVFPRNQRGRGPRSSLQNAIWPDQPLRHVQFQCLQNPGLLRLGAGHATQD